jgi:diguanylate cyclase (GGDEF)-like protein
LKASPLTSRIPVIFLTAKSSLDDRLEGLNVYADDYVTKPWERQELLFRVRNQLRTRRAQLSSNALTGLPGNVLIENELTRRITAHEKFAFLHLDLDNFKAYNDYYGYQRGDLAIRMMSRILVDVVVEHGHPTDFVGHVGGDDFVVITTPDKMVDVAETITRRWDKESRDLFTREDLDAGFIRVRNRRGEMESFSLMTLTVAAVPSNKYKINHLAQLNDLASELKRYGKSLKGSVVVYERRGDSGPILMTGTEN